MLAKNLSPLVIVLAVAAASAASAAEEKTPGPKDGGPLELVAGPLPMTGRAAAELRALRGRWKAVSCEIDGERLPREDVEDWALAFKGSQLWRRPNGVETLRDPFDPQAKPTVLDKSLLPMEFALDPGTEPKELNVEIGWSGVQAQTPRGLRRAGEPIYQKSIYRLDGDKLTVCWGGESRPKGFAAKRGDGTMLIVYERVRRGPVAVEDLNPDDIPDDLPQELKYLIDMTFSDNRTMQGYAVRELGTMGERARPAVPFLLRVYLTERRAPYRWEIFPALQEIGGPAVAACVDALKQASSAELRCDLIRNLAFYFRGPAVLDAVVDCLGDQSPEVRRTAIELLGEWDDPRAAGPLIAALKDRDAAVRRVVVGAVSGFDDPRAVAPLVAIMRDPREDIEARFLAAAKIDWLRVRKKNDPRYAPALAVLKDDLAFPLAAEWLRSIIAEQKALKRRTRAAALEWLRE